MRLPSWFYGSSRWQHEPRPRHTSALHLEVLEDRALPSTFLVTSLGDTGTGSGSSGDLRYCLTQADSTPGSNTINFAVTGIINLHSALPHLSTNIALVGPSTGSLTAQPDQGGPSFNIFTVDAGADAGISNVYLNGGSSGNGGGITNYGTLVLSNSSLHGNSGTNGGGIFNAGDLNVNDCTVYGNDATNGGGIYNAGNLTVTNSTIYGNTAISGGGIWSNSSARLTNVTAYLNLGSVGGAIDVAGGSFVLCNTFVRGFRSTPGFPADISGSVEVSRSYNNLISDGSGGLDPAKGNLVGDGGTTINTVQGNYHTPPVTELADYGGPTLTCDLLPDSLLLGKGSTVFVTPGETDQRGQPRIVNGTVDIGAVQSQGFSLIVVAGSGQITLPNTPFAIPLQARITENGHGVRDAVVTFTAPASGPSATFWDYGGRLPVQKSSIAVVTDLSGLAETTTATANGIFGTYLVTANGIGIPGSVTFPLTNGTPPGPGNTGGNPFPSALPNAVHQQLNLNMLAMPLWNNPQGQAWLADQFWMWYGLAFLQSPQQANFLFWQDFDLTRDLFQAQGSMAQMEKDPQTWQLAWDIAANPLYNTPIGYGMALLESEWLLVSVV